MLPALAYTNVPGITSPGGSDGTTTSFEGVGVRAGPGLPLEPGPCPPETPVGSCPLPRPIVTSAMRTRPTTDSTAAMGAPDGSKPYGSRVARRVAGRGG